MIHTLKHSMLGLGIGLLIALLVGTVGIRSASSQGIPTEPPIGGDGEVTTERYAGPDRFATSVEISKAEFPDGADTVYLARADNFADAVSGGALTGGPILLVPSCDELPDVTAEELGRLAASSVVALGGTSAVCDQVLEDAAAASASGDGTEEPTDEPSPTASPTATETETEGDDNPLPIDIPTGPAADS